MTRTDEVDRVSGAVLFAIGILLMVLSLWCCWDQYIAYPERQHDYDVLIDGWDRAKGQVPSLFGPSSPWLGTGYIAAFAGPFLTLAGTLLAIWGINEVKKN